MSGSSSQGALHPAGTSSLRRSHGVRMVGCCAAGQSLRRPGVRDNGGEARRGAEGARLAHVQGQVRLGGERRASSNGQPAWELYQEVSQTPAAMQTVRAALAVAGLKGFTPKVRDATQAYLQSRIDTPDKPATWVRLPKAWWPASWHGLYRDPMCRLRLALYRHPESGALWDKHLSAIFTRLGWVRQEVHPGFWPLTRPPERS